MSKRKTNSPFNTRLKAGTPTSSSESQVVQGSPVRNDGSIIQFDYLSNQKEKIDYINNEISKTFSSQRPSTTKQQTIPNLNVLDEGKVPSFIPVPGYPIIPEGYIPVMMSPRGFLVPMTFSVNNPIHGIPGFSPTTPTPKSITNTSTDCTSTDDLQSITPPHSDFSSNEESFELGDKRKLPTVEATETFNYSPLKKSKKLKTLNNNDKLAALRLCLISSASYQNNKFENPLKIQYESFVDYYNKIEDELNYQSIRNRLVNRLEVLTKYTDQSIDPFNEINSKSNDYLNGIERDLCEKKDYELLRIELIREYKKNQILDSFLDETLETYSSICIDYTKRLLRFKKFLLQQREILKKDDKSIIHDIKSNKSERIWRSMYNDLINETNRNFKRRQRHSRNNNIDGINSDNDSSSSSTTASNLRRSSSRIKRLVSDDDLAIDENENDNINNNNDNNSKTNSNNNKNQKTNKNSRLALIPREQVLDELSPIISNNEFRTLTNDKSKTYEFHILNNNNTKISNQNDIVKTIKNFKISSKFNKMITQSHQQSSSLQNASKSKINSRLLKELSELEEMNNRSNSIFSTNSNNSNNYNNNGNEGDETNDEADHSSSSLLDSTDFSKNLIKYYKFPTGLDTDEIESDLLILRRV